MAERRSCSRTETLAAARAPRRNDLAAALGRHTSAITMPALAHQFARLVSSFHRTLSAARKTRVFAACRSDINSVADARLARLIRDPSRLVNATRTTSPLPRRNSRVDSQNARVRGCPGAPFYPRPSKTYEMSMTGRRRKNPRSIRGFPSCGSCRPVPRHAGKRTQSAYF
jgi:hypothetical protein